ncbi:MAG: NAD(P)-dependent dehydrogenase (short-subunit alcohol dehydrogenase family) [Halieaceae bacterium]|jgi:NAD(P)-dependent dehydrogenase (short-subunit alcohol dehydrogenase family)
MKHAVVTGAGSGIGAEIARALATAGYRVSLLGRRLQALEATAASIELADSCQCIPCDVSDEIDTEAAFTRAISNFQPVDVLVNCAGSAPTAPFHKLDSTQWQQVMGVNLHGVFHCTAQVIKHMRKQRSGRIINIASTASLRGYAYVSAYAAAKHGVLGLTRSLALETATLGITVNAVCPGFTDTDIIRDAVTNIVEKTGRSEQDVLSEFTKVNPQGRLIDPAEVASTVIWLCSESARSVNGQAIAICGGETC